MPRCAHCDGPLPEAARFCSACGSPVSSISQMPTAAGGPAARSPRVSSAAEIGRLDSSSSFDAGGFAPGTVIAERYRVIGLLGRGGMGEVYRADDLKLGQSVALKFLPSGFSKDAVFLDRFRAEVRNARQVSHPNVCRVYDIGEVDGRHFLSMEYVDGENLATLLRRIGRLPGTKALEIARQLCAGLAAAHAQGVLHRDIKPSNVMIGGHGRAKLTDFGLAIRGDEAADGEISGTPAYMAPEQIAGRGATVQSDLYSLGLVLYEVYTGKKTFEASSFAEWRRVHAEQQPTALTQHAADIDAAVERAILRCLEKEPAKRPASALQLAAALPGGDPLAAALAAGETPSPELVAASGETAGLRAGVAWAVLLATFAIIGLVAWLNGRAMLIGRVRPEKPPDVMAERAREIIQKFSFSRAPVDSVFGYRTAFAYLDSVQKKDKSPDRWDRLSPQAIEFWYRQSPFSLLPRIAFGSNTNHSDPPVEVPGEVSILLDARGRLLGLEAIPPQKDESPSPGVSPDWNKFLLEAGYDPAQFKPATPQWTPEHYVGTRTAWERSASEPPDVVRIEAGAYREKVVYFLAVSPWATASRDSPGVIPASLRLLLAIAIFWLALLVVGGVWFAVRNLRLGRGDRRGATRLAAFTGAGFLVIFTLSVHHSAGVEEILYLLSTLSVVLYFTGSCWILYVALEPFVRRRWPHVLITWTRVLGGAFRDPLLGRDIAIGCLAGALQSLLLRAELLVPRWAGLAAPQSIGLFFQLFSVPRSLIRVPIGSFLFAAMLGGLAIVFALTFFRVLLRKQWAAMALLLAILAVAHAAPSDPPLLAGAFGLLLWGIPLVVLARWGMCALLVTLWVSSMLHDYPMTFDSAAWYAGMGQAGLAVIAAITIYGFYTALGGKPMFGAAALDD